MTTSTFPLNRMAHIGFGLTYVIILTVLGVSFWGLHEAVSNFEAVIHTEQVSEELLRLFADVKEAEDHQRDFLITQSPQYLGPYKRAIQHSHQRIEALETLTVRYGRLYSEFPTLKQLIQARMALLQETLDLQRTHGTQAMVDAILSQKGMRLMNQIRDMILTVAQKDTASLTRLHHMAHEMENFTLVTMVLGMVLTFFAGLVTLWKLKQELLERYVLEQRLFEESKVAEIGRLVGEIGHDIKNMLTPVQMGMTLLEEELKDHFARLSSTDRNQTAKTRELTHEIISLTQRGTQRIQDRVKEISDAVKGRSSPPHFAPCHIESIVHNVLEALRLSAKERGILLETQNLDAVPSLLADEQRLFNAFYNLVNNAIPEVPPGGSVTIRGECVPNRDEVILTVQDTGRGMPEEIKQTLFTGKVISRKPGGTGLGTKIVKDAVDIHGGSIRVESTEGKGTTFFLHLPLRQPNKPGK